MARIKVWESIPWGYEGDVSEIRIAGWFDDSRASSWTEAVDWDGSNMQGRSSGIPREFGGQVLWRTAGGRWVLETDARGYFSGDLTRRFVSATEARDWLLRNDQDEDAETYFGPLLPEAGPDTSLHCVRPGDDSQTEVDLTDPPAWFTREYAALLMYEAEAAGDTSGAALVRAWLSGTISSGEAQA